MNCPQQEWANFSSDRAYHHN